MFCYYLEMFDGFLCRGDIDMGVEWVRVLERGTDQVDEEEMFGVWLTRLP